MTEIATLQEAMTVTLPGVMTEVLMIAIQIMTAMTGDTAMEGMS